MAFVWKDNDPKNGQKETDEIWKEQNEFWRGVVGPIDAISLAFRRAFDYKGLSTRAEFWWFSLFAAAINAFSYQIAESIFLFFIGKDDPAGVLVLSIFSSFVIAIVMMIVWLPLTIRRIRDTGKHPLWITSYILPFALFSGSILIKEEFHSIYIWACVVLSLIVIIGMMVIYLMPSRSN